MRWKWRRTILGGVIGAHREGRVVEGRVSITVYGLASYPYLSSLAHIVREPRLDRLDMSDAREPELELDEYGRDGNGIIRSNRPTYEGLGIRCINFLLLFFYLLLFGGAVTGIALPCIWPNQQIPLLITVLIFVLVVVLHLLVKILGKVCVQGYLLYPVAPKYIYMISDGVLLFMLVGVGAAYVLDTVLSDAPVANAILPMLGCWVSAVAMLINWHLVWRVTYEGPALPPKVTIVGPDTSWDDFTSELQESGF